jgi:transcription elongation factor Elf1
MALARLRIVLGWSKHGRHNERRRLLPAKRLVAATMTVLTCVMCMRHRVFQGGVDATSTSTSTVCILIN